MLRTAARTAARQTRSAKPSTLAPRSSRAGLPACSVRAISTSLTRMAALPTVTPPVSFALPADSFHLLSTEQKAGAAEDALFAAEVEQVEQWWASPRYKGIKRPYSAEDVVGKRGSLQQTYPSSLMGRKLFNLLEERASQGLPVHTSASFLPFSKCISTPAPIPIDLLYIPKNSILLQSHLFSKD